MTHCCADPAGRCLAVVAHAGERCPIHRHAQQGPYSLPCKACRQDIEAAHLWVRVDGWVYHVDCRCAAPRPRRAKKSWDHGLGLFAGGEP